MKGESKGNPQFQQFQQTRWNNDAAISSQDYQRQLARETLWRSRGQLIEFTVIMTEKYAITKVNRYLTF